MNAVIDTVSQTIRECVSAIPVSPDLLAITAQGDGLWLTRDDGSPVRPAIVWSDTRAFGHVDEWFRNGIAAAAFRQSGNVPFAGSAAALLLALEATEPESLDQARTAAYCKDVLLQAFTGVRSTDVSDASLPFLDQRSRGYDESLVDLFRVRRWRHLHWRPSTPSRERCIRLPAGERPDWSASRHAGSCRTFRLSGHLYWRRIARGGEWTHRSRYDARLRGAHRPARHRAGTVRV